MPIWLRYAVGSIAVILAAAAAVLIAAEPEAFESDADSAGGCAETAGRLWDRFELGDGGRTVRIIYYDSGSIRPCGLRFEEGGVAVRTADPSLATADLAQHCVEFRLPSGQSSPLVLRDARNDQIHVLGLGLYDGVALGSCVRVGSPPLGREVHLSRVRTAIVVRVDFAFDLILFLAFAVIYALLCRWVAEYADRKGQPYWFFALLSLFITPLWGGVIAVLAPNQSQGHVPRTQR